MLECMHISTLQAIVFFSCITRYKIQGMADVWKVCLNAILLEFLILKYCCFCVAGILLWSYQWTITSCQYCKFQWPAYISIWWPSSTSFCFANWCRAFSRSHPCSSCHNYYWSCARCSCCFFFEHIYYLEGCTTRKE